MSEPSGDNAARPRAGRRWVRLVVVLAVVVAVVWFARRELPPLSVLAQAFDQVNLPLLAGAAGLEALSLWLFARQQQYLFAGFGVRVPVGSVLAITYSRSAMSMTFPAGSLASAVFAVDQFRQHGASRATATTVTVLSGLVSTAGLAALYGLGALAALLFPGPGQIVAALVGALLILRVSVALVGRHGRVPGPVEPVTPAAATGFAHRMLATARAQLAEMATVPGRYWAGGIGFAAANWATDLACLVVTGAAFGLRVPVVTTGVLYLGIQLVRQIPLSPGGIGVIETSLTAGLLMVGATSTTAAATALGYRLLSCWLIIPIGLATWLALTRGKRSHNTPENVNEPLDKNLQAHPIG